MEQHPHPLRAKRAKEFKERIGFDALAAKEMPDKGIVADWPNCGALFGLTESDWSADESLHMLTRERLTERECILKRPGERLWVRMYVSTASAADVREQLIRLATDTSLPKVPYVPGPADLGTLSLTVPGLGDYIVSFYNVGFIVFSDEGGRDALSRW
jgi:hypothetical protein